MPESAPAAALPSTGRPWFAHRTSIVLGLLVAALAAGGAGYLAGARAAADILWSLAAVGALIPLVVGTAQQLWRRQLGVDVVAIAALAGCVALGEYLAGSVIAVMYASGQTLEDYAQRRARRELTALAARTPHDTLRHEGTELVAVGVAEVAVGDVLLIRTGDIVPVDGHLASPAAVLDESALTGEALPVEHSAGDAIRSGTINAGPAFDLTASSTAAGSTYQGIIDMVRRAADERAPLVRLADRYAGIFVIATAVVAAVAGLAARDLVRALAVVVVATPCPLIIAAPVAVVAGVSRAARAGLVVKGGGVLEQLASVRALVFDKTGTLTAGTPIVKEVRAAEGHSEAEVLGVAASVDQLSSHPLAGALVAAARQRGLTLVKPELARERAGEGISGVVRGSDIRVGRADFVGVPEQQTSWEAHLRRKAALESLSMVCVAAGDELIGVILVGDQLRPDSARMIRRLRAAGLSRVVMATGDHPEIAAATAAALGLDEFAAERAPDEKALIVSATRAGYGPVAFVGDGINDAPALATADVGVAIGSRGIGAASEAADAVLVVDRLDRLADGVLIARRSRRLALESILVGMGLSLGAMVVAALGLLPPVAGAVTQEVIDVVVILNALRALAGRESRRPDATLVTLGGRLREEHRHLTRGIDGLRELADAIGDLPPAQAIARLQATVGFVQTEVLPHEADEEQRFYPLMARHIGGSDPVAPMLRAHVEIVHLARSLDAVCRELADSPGDDAARVDARRLLYALHAVLSLHNAQEEDAYISLVADEAADVTSPVTAGKGAGRHR